MVPSMALYWRLFSRPETPPNPPARFARFEFVAVRHVSESLETFSIWSAMTRKLVCRPERAHALRKVNVYSMVIN